MQTDPEYVYVKGQGWVPHRTVRRKSDKPPRMASVDYGIYPQDLNTVCLECDQELWGHYGNLARENGVFCDASHTRLFR